MGSSGILGRVSHHSKASVLDWVGSEFFFFFLEIAPLIAKQSSKQQEEVKAASYSLVSSNYVNLYGSWTRWAL